MNIRFGLNEELNEVNITKNKNDDTYKVVINGKVTNKNFDFNCDKCDSIVVSLNTLSDSNMKTREN